MPITCPTHQTDRAKRKFDHNERDQLSWLTKQYQRRMRRLAQDPRYDPTVYDNLLKKLAEQEWLANLTDLASLSTKRIERFQDFLSSEFGILNRLGIDPSNYSVAGDVRYGLTNAQKVIEGLIANAGRLEGSIEAKKLVEMARRFNPRLSRTQLSDLVHETFEVGLIPQNMSAAIAYRTKALGNQTLVERFQNQRYNNYVTRMQSAGFNRSQIDSMINQAAKVSQAYDRIRAAARAAGVDIARLDDIGYINRVLTSDFKIRIQDVSAEQLLEELAAGNDQFSSVFNRSRSTWHYVPEDLVVASQIMGITPDQIRNLTLGDPLVWRKYLDENLTKDQLDMLVDSGVMAKLPMTSRDVFQYFVRQYDMPYTNVSEMFITDPTTLVAKYTASLQEAAGNAGMIRRLLTDEAFTQGWSTTRQVVEQNPEMYSNFVSLGDQFNRWAQKQKIPVTQLLGNMGLNTQTITRLQDIYVHPVVARQWSATMAMAMNPSLMNGISQQIYFVGRWMSRRALTSTQYVFRTMLGSMVAATAAGGSMFAQLPSLIDTFKVFSGGLGRFDNTKVIWEADGRQWTKRQLFEEFLINFGQSTAPGSVEERIAAGLGDFSPRAVADYLLGTPERISTAAGHWWTYTMAFGDPVNGRRIPFYERPIRAVRKTGQMFNQIIEDSFQPFAVAANLVDFAYKWSVFQTVVGKVGTGNELMDEFQQFITSGQIKRFSSLQDAYRHIDEYFVSPYNTGRAVAAANNFVMPFRTWAMANPPMQLRHALRNPHLYLTYWRLRSMANDDLEEYNKAQIPGWIQEGIPVHMFTDENGMPVVLMPNNFDPISDAFVFANELREDVQRIVFNEPVGTEEEKREWARGESFENWLSELFSQTHTPIRLAVEQLLGKETFLGRPIAFDELDQRPTLWGIPIPARMKHVVELLMPPIRAIDSLNPNGVFGVAPKYDYRGQLIDPGRLSWLGTERTASDRYLYAEESDLIRRTLRIAGLQIQTIDTNKTVQQNLTDIEFTISDLDSQINDASRELRVDLLDGNPIDRDEWERRRRALTNRIDIAVALRIDQMRLQQFAYREGIPNRSMMNSLENLRINLNNLPHPAADEIREGALRIYEEQLRLLAESRQYVQ